MKRRQDKREPRLLSDFKDLAVIANQTSCGGFRAAVWFCDFCALFFAGKNFGD